MACTVPTFIYSQPAKRSGSGDCLSTPHRPIPDELRSADAAFLLCAGITTYNALRNAGLGGRDLVAVQGTGGLGHLDIQFCAARGVPYGETQGLTA
jgi:NADPH:quinone reductase-like Zn-dependent oxidoreductase